MFTYIGSNMIYNIVEYFSFVNVVLLAFILIIIIFSILLFSTFMYYINVNYNHGLIECCSALLCIVVLIILISPAFLILLDINLVVIPNTVVYVFGLQWAWQYSVKSSSIQTLLPDTNGQLKKLENNFCDHYILHSNQFKQEIGESNSKLEGFTSDCYLNIVNNYMVGSVTNLVKYIVFSLDVIHSFSANGYGLKVDALPGRISVTNAYRTENKGEYRGMCYELCGQGHLVMVQLLNSN